jgi:hypothetical protein
MKNKIVILFLFSLLIPLHFSYAYIPLPSSTDLGGASNPINIQIQPNPREQMRQENLLRESQLKSQYGYSVYSSCKPSACGSYNAIDPYSESSCLSMLEAWLGRGICQAQKQQAIDNLQCATGYVKLNRVCVSFSQSCNLQYPNTFFINYDESGKRVCDCKSGYIWNEQRTSCVVAPTVPVKTNDQACSDKFGQSWKWDGTKNSEGFLNCGCINGYTQINGECTASPIIPVKTNDRICIEDYGINSTWSGKLNEKNGPICDCKINYVWNKGGTTCLSIPKAETKTIAPVIKTVSEVKENITINKSDPIDKVVTTNTTEVKPKSFWARLKGWLGF